MGYTKEVSSCTLAKLDNLEEDPSCQGNSLYSQLKNDKDLSFKKLAKNIREEITSQNHDYDTSKSYLYDRSAYKNACSLNDVTVNEIFFRSKGKILTRLLSNLNPLEEDKSLFEQASNILSQSGINKDDISQLKNFAKDPYFYELLNNPHPQNFGNLKNLNLYNDNLLDKFVSDLDQECRNVFKIAKQTLCGSKSKETVANFKDLKMVLEGGDVDIIDQSHILKNYCENMSKVDIPKFDEVQKKNYGFLPKYIIERPVKSSAKLTFGDTQNEIRKKICDKIPPQANLEDSLKNCAPNSDDYTCQYLVEYKAILEKEFVKDHPMEEFAKLAHKDGTKFTQDEIKKAYNDAKKDYTKNFSKIMGEKGEVSLKSPLMSHFLATPEKLQNKDVGAIVNQNVPGEGQKNGVGDSETAKSGSSDGRRGFGGSINSGRSIASSSGGGQQSLPNSKGLSHGSNNSTGPESYFNDIQSDYQQQQELNKELVRRMFKKKTNAFDKDVNGTNTTRKLTHKEKKERKKALEKFKEDYIAPSSSSLVANSSPLYDEEDLLASQRFDENFGNNSGRAPASYNSQPKSSNGPGFYKDAATGEIVKTPTVGMESVPNSGFGGTGINTGASTLNELTQITLYGTLAEDLSTIDPETVEVLDANSAQLVKKINKLVENKEPFVIKNEYEDNQKILVKFNEFGGFNLFVKDEVTGRFKPATEVTFRNQVYEAFYKNIQKAFNQNFLAKFTH